MDSSNKHDKISIKPRQFSQNMREKIDYFNNFQMEDSKIDQYSHIGFRNIAV